MKKDGKKLTIKVKSERGAITALVLASFLLILVVLINLYMVGSSKSTSQDKEIEAIQEAYNYTSDEMESKYQDNIVFANVNTEQTTPKAAIPANVKEIVEADANKGIVIKDKNENEWVWVEVPKTTVFSGLNIDVNGTFTSQNYIDIANKMITYAGVYRKGSVNQECNWTDEWYDGCGLTQQEYIKAYQSMLKSVYTYGGFWIGRYEAGIDGSITDLTKARITHTTVTIGTSPKAISQKDAIPYNFVYCSEAQMLANEMTPDSNYRSSLMFGIQWDLVCKFLEVKSNLTTADINSDSGSWGNYSNIARKITSSRAKQSSNNGMTWTSISGQKESKNIMLSTGASDDTNRLNIYDFAGNEWEWTLEKSSESLPCSGRGGSCGNTTNGFVTSARNEADVEGNDNYASFRPTLYKK
jgi:hypothetical protein